MNMGIDNHLCFFEDEAGTKEMFACENRARERFVTIVLALPRLRNIVVRKNSESVIMIW